MELTFPKGLIIAFDGLDCSFKETNYRNFVRRLRLDSRYADKTIVTESFPRYSTEEGHIVSKWLQNIYDREIMKQLPIAANSLYAIDRMSFWIEKVHGTEFRRIHSYGEDTHTYIFDRYLASSSIYNPIHGIPTVEDFTYETEAFGVPKPDINVFMRMRDFGVLKSLLAKKENKDEQEMDTSYLEGVWKNAEYVIENELFQKAGIELVVIDCLNPDLSIKSESQLEIEVATQINEAVNKVLATKNGVE